MTAQPPGTISPEIRRIAQAITDLQKAAKDRTPQLAHTALEDGSIREFADDVQVAQYGKQFDGTSAPAILVSPPPPAPSTPVAVGVAGGIKVFWNGTFENDITTVAPMDWRQIDVVAGPVGMDPIATPPSVSITSPRGGEVFIPAVAGNYEVALVSRTLAGRPSDPSASVAVTALALVDDAQFQQALTDLTAAEGRLDTAEVDISDNLTEIEAAKVRITAAEQDVTDALAGLVTKNSVFAQASAPTSTGRIDGDIWIDTDDNQKVYRWAGSWVLTDLASTAYIASRSTNLVTNGSALLKTTQNFSMFTLDQADMPEGAAGSFDSVLGAGSTLTLDEIMPVDPAKKFKFAYQAKQKGTTSGGYLYGFLQPLDAFKLAIGPEHIMYTANTLTTLAAPLNPGDTTVTLTSSANWYGSAAKPAGASIHLRRIIFWDYVDAGGKAWPENTYSRNVTATNFWADGGIVGNVITLAAPYAGTAKAAGTKLSNGSSGGTYMYGGAVNALVPKAWTTYTDSVIGTVSGGGAATVAAGWPPGVGYAKVGFLVNRIISGPPDAASKHSVALLYFGDAQAAQDRADSAYTLAGAKATVYRQSTAPALGMATNDIWFDLDDGKVYVYTGAWTLTDDARIGEALTNAAIAQAAAEKNDAVNANPNFTDWPGALPTAWAAYGTGPTKEVGTVYVRTLPNAARFNCTDTTTERGLYHALSDLPVGTEYVTVSIDIRAASGTFSGAGILLDWTGMTGGNRASWNFHTDIPAPVANKWYRLTKVLRRPATAVGTHASWLTYVMGQYTGWTRTVKDISIDRVAYRASSVEEISAYNSASAATVSSLTTTVNAKTTVFVQASQPTTTGRTVGDLWLDSDDGNKPYDWTGSWTARQFGDSALASLDLNKLVVVGTANLNQAIADHIATKTAAIQTADIKNLFVTDGAVLNDVVAQRIASDVGEFITVRANNLESVMAMVTTLTSGGTGRRWEAGPDGIRVYESDGSILINFPTDPNTPSSFYGDLVATSLTVADQLAIRGLVNEVSKGAQLVLAGGTTAPAGPPSVVIDWENWDTRHADGDPAYAGFNPPRYGWVRWLGYWWLAQGTWGMPVAVQPYNDAGDYLAYTPPIMNTTDFGGGDGGVTVVGGNLYVLGVKQLADFSYQWWVEGFDSTGARIARWQYVLAANSRKPKLGNDGTNLVIAYSTTTANLLVWQYRNPTTGAVVGSTISSNTTLAKEMGSFYYGSADFGSARAIFTGVGTANAYCTTAAGVYQPNETFPMPSANIQGMDYYDNVFWSHDASGGKYYKHSGHKWTTESSMWHVSNTWYDSNATGGTHETAQGPRKSFTMKKRARLLVTTGLLPVRPIPNTTDDAVATRLYLGRGAADPGRTSMERAATLADGLRNGTILSHTFPAAGAAINPPPATSDFPASSPGRIISADGTSVVINGDGSFTLGPITRSPAGVMAITGEGWVAPTLGNSWANYALGHQNAGYRKLLNGTVELRGLIKSGTTNTVVFTLPVGFRPLAQEIFTGISSVGAARIDVFANGEVRVVAYYSGGVNTFVSLAGIHFDTLA